MEIQRLRYLFGDVFKIGLLTILITIVFFGVYTFVTRDNDIYGKLPRSYFQNSLTNEVVWDVSAVSLDAPAQEVVFKVKSRKISRKQSWDLAGKLGLPKGGNITLDKRGKENFTSTTPEKELFVGLDNGVVHFKNSKALSETKGEQKISKSKALEAAKQQLTILGISNKQYNLNKPEYEYLSASKNSNHLIETEESKANIVYISFPREIDGAQVATTGGLDSLSVGVNSNYVVFSLDYSVLEIEPSDARYKLISKNSVKNKLKKGEGKLNRYLEDSEDVGTSPSLIRVGKGGLYFYDDKQTEFIVPIYIFKALASQENRNAKEAEIYLLSLKDFYFSK